MTQLPRATTAQRLDALARPDKWYLSAGDGVLWAPPFPAWLHVPGFWDEAHVYYHAVAPLFAVAVVDVAGRAVPLERVSWRWRPDRIDAQWRLPSGEVLDEQRTAAPGGRFVSSWRVPGTWRQRRRGWWRSRCSRVTRRATSCRSAMCRSRGCAASPIAAVPRSTSR